MTELTQDQFEALRSYAKQNGRTWKSSLRHDWETGRASCELQNVRNTFGPAWLVRFRLPAEKEG